MKYYIYYMYDKNDKLLYIGKTKNLMIRIRAHFSKSSITKEGWKKDVCKIQYSTLKDKTSATIYEIYFINKLKPKCNIEYAFNTESIALELPDLIKKTYSYIENKKPVIVEKKMYNISNHDIGKGMDYECYKNDIKNNVSIFNIDKFIFKEFSNEKIKRDVYLAKTIKNRIISFIRFRMKSKKRYWTCDPENFNLLKGAGYTKDYINVYSEVEKGSLDCDSAVYAYSSNKEDLRLLLNFITNLNIKRPINLYIPSKKLKIKLVNWLNS